MKKILTKIIGASLAIAMMIGAGVGVNAAKAAKEVNADPGNTPTGSWTPITSASEVNTSDDFLLAYEGASNIYYGTGTVSSKALTVSSSLSNAKTVKFETVSGGYRIKISSTNYLNNSSKTEMSSGTSATATWTINNSDLCVENTSNSNRFLGGASDGGNIKAYASSNKNDYPHVHIYKQSAGKTLTGISVATAPDKTTYYAGEFFDPTGLVITRTYSDSTSDTYSYANHESDFTFEPSTSTALTVQNTSVTITYGEKTATQAITVNAPRTMTGIELHGAINKTEYYVGDSWDLEGLDIQINWSDGDPTFVDLDDNAVIYECDPATATSTSVESFDIEVMYSDFDEVFTVDGLTVVEHPLIDVLNKTTIPNAAIGANTSSWGVWTEVTDFTYSASNSNGAKYQVKLMGPGSDSYVGRMNDSTNGGFYTSKAPVGVRIKTIAFSSIAASKDVSVYLSNEAYGSLPAATDYKATLTSTNLSYTVEGTYSCFAIRGRSSSLDVGALTIEYEEINPSISASPSSITLSSNGAQNVEITAENYTSIPSLECVVQSGATSIESATVGAINNLTYKATATITASNVSGNAVVRVRDVANPDLYYVDINVVVQSAKEVIENTVTTSSSLAYRYNKSGANTDTLNKDFINLEDDNYANWTGKTGASGAVYAGNTYGPAENIQIRSNNNNSGIVTTSSGGLAKKITVVWNSGTQNGRTLDVFGKNSAYEAATDLYDGTKKGTKLGSIVKGTDTSLTIAGDYEFIGLRSNTGAMNIESIDIQWGEYSYTYSDISMRFGGSIDEDLWNELDSNENPIAGVGVLITGYEEHLRTPYSIKEHYNEAVQLNEVTDIEAQVANCYVSLSTFNIPQKNNCYYWNLKYAIASIDDMLDSYTAAAYIKLTNGELVFLKQVKYSVWSLAKDYLDNRNCDEETSDGSLYNIVESAGLE